MTEEVQGQKTLPAEFPEPVLTCDLIIERELRAAWSAHRKDQEWLGSTGRSR